MAVETFENDESNASVRQKLNDTIEAVQELMETTPPSGGLELPEISFTGNWIADTSFFTVPAGALSFYPAGITVSGNGNWLQNLYIYEGNNEDGFLTLEFTNLTGVVEDFELENFNEATSIRVPELKVVGDSFSIYSMPNLEELYAPKLVAAGRRIQVENLGNVSEINLPKLEFTENVNLNNSDNLTLINLPMLSEVESFYIESNPLLTTVNVPSLEKITDYLYFRGDESLTGLELPSIVRLHQVMVDNDMLVFSHWRYGPNLVKVTGSQLFNGTALDAASVEHILETLSSLDGTGGTTAFENNTVELQGDNAAITVPCVQYIETLNNRSCNVNVNYPLDVSFSMTAGQLAGKTGYKRGQFGSVGAGFMNSFIEEVSTEGGVLKLTAIGPAPLHNNVLNNLNLWIDDIRYEGYWGYDQDTRVVEFFPDSGYAPLTFANAQTYSIEIKTFT